jgi:hypothetical protein
MWRRCRVDGDGKYFSESLGENGKCPGRYVTIFLRGHHLLDSSDLCAGKLLKTSPGTRRDIVQCTALFASPRAISRRRQFQGAKLSSEREALARMLNRAPEERFLRASIDPAAGEREAGDLKQDDYQTQHSKEPDVAFA